MPFLLPRPVSSINTVSIVKAQNQSLVLTVGFFWRPSLQQQQLGSKCVCVCMPGAHWRVRAHTWLEAPNFLQVKNSPGQIVKKSKVAFCTSSVREKNPVHLTACAGSGAHFFHPNGESEKRLSRHHTQLLPPPQCCCLQAASQGRQALFVRVRHKISKIFLPETSELRLVRDIICTLG